MSVLKILIVLGILAWTISRAVRKDPSGEMPFPVTFKRLIPGVFLLIIAAFTLPSIGQVGAGERGVVTQFGKVTGRILGEGIYVVVPLAESVEIMDVQVHAHAVPATGASKDLQNVTTEVTVNHALIPDGVAEVYQELRRDYVIRVLGPSVQEAVKSSTAQFTAEELITKRAEVKDIIQNVLAERLASHSIRVDAVSITDFQFSAEFNDAIEKKVTAAQKALTAENDLKRIQFEADQRIAQARGEAEAIRIQAESISKQGGAEYVRLKWVEAWEKGGSQMPKIITGDQTATLLQISE